MVMNYQQSGSNMIPWDQIISFLITIAMLIIDKTKASDEAKKHFYRLIDAYDRDVPLRQSRSIKDQIERLRGEDDTEILKQQSTEEAEQYYRELHQDAVEEIQELNRKILKLSGIKDGI